MTLEQAIQFVPRFAVGFFRVAALFLVAPLFGSARIPRRVKLLFALVTTMGLMGVTDNPLTWAPSFRMPSSVWHLTLGIGGEILFGLAMGMAVSFVFYSVHWAGEIIGQQMGINLGETFDPQYGSGGSVIGDAYFLLTLVVFLLIRGHHILLRSVAASFDALPLLSVGMNADLLSMLVGLMGACTTLAIQLAAPVLVTLLTVELVMGFISKTVPQMNVMTVGLSLRSAVGIVVLIVGIGLSNEVIRGATTQLLEQAGLVWRGQPAG